MTSALSGAAAHCPSLMLRALSGAAAHCPSLMLRTVQAWTQVAECVGEQPGDVHLGYAELVADLALCHAVVVAKEQNLLLSRWQLAPVRGDGLDAEDLL